MVRNSLFDRVVFGSIFVISSLGVDVGSLAVGLHSSNLYAEVDWFYSPSQILNKPQTRNRPVPSKAAVLFFVSPECRSCPEEAAKLEGELKRLGWTYQIEGIFVGKPTEVGRYLAELRTYPFNFELGLDMDGKFAEQHRVNTFPTAIIQVDGKRVVVTKASELSEKLQ